ncbi:MAG: zinc transporter ZupT [Desulfovermiculus sp.]|nr:zinc transporter ZupT [Desulfovermiculus sp.]
MEHSSVLLAFSLTLGAGLATGIGSTLAFFSRGANPKFLAGALGFSAGVMIYVSFVEILPKARDSLVHPLGLHLGSWLTVGAFFAGIALIAVIDALVPSYENPHEAHRIDALDDRSQQIAYQKLLRTGHFTALAIALHNFPEGLATFTATLKDPSLGLPIAVAIAIHNIPEGIAVSVPLYYATGSRSKAFLFSLFSGLAEPVGAGVGYLLLLPFFNDLTFGILFAGVGGLMVYISMDELLPTAEEYGQHHVAMVGLVLGMLVMAVSLLLFL